MNLPIISFPPIIIDISGIQPITVGMMFCCCFLLYVSFVVVPFLFSHRYDEMRVVEPLP